MKLYHFTAGNYLRGIAEHGLTVGDVPTDMARFAGKVGVWFTTSPTPIGHGLEGGRLNKKRFRLHVDLPVETPALFKWTDWETHHVTPETQRALRICRPGDDDYQADSWYVLFGHLKPKNIVSVVDTSTGTDVEDWPNVWPADDSLPGVPYWRREAWQKRTLKRAKKLTLRNSALAQRAA
jgi:hypothetical protein